MSATGLTRTQKWVFAITAATPDLMIFSVIAWSRNVRSAARSRGWARRSSSRWSRRAWPVLGIAATVS